MRTLRPNLVLMSVALLFLAPILDGGSKEEDFSEALLSKDNAHNPIPSPDGNYIAYSERVGAGQAEAAASDGQT